ncbi:unnamed protein product, partial [marine sediment metagenome]
MTNDGWKQIREIKEGDLIVSESGEMKKVEAVIKSKPSKYVRIYVKGSIFHGAFFSITGDPEHLIKTSNGWRKFGELKKGESIFYLASKCKECGKLCRFKAKYCSRNCQSIWHYKYGKGKKGLNIGHIKAKEIAQGRDNKLITKKGRKWRKENPEAVKAYHKRQGKTLAKFYQKNPHKHPNAICAKNHRLSGLEKKIQNLIKDSKLSYVNQLKVGKYWVD